ncbi:MAG: hypothetical protein ACLFTQ_02415 [Candidatus Aenigmatarchaeota archaeon]
MAEGKNIFLVCPVRDLSEEEKKEIESYKESLEETGHEVYYPPEDTDQSDPYGLNICLENKEGLKRADEVHVYWNEKSRGSLHDLGMVTMAEKPLRLINREELEFTEGKSFTNVLLLRDSLTRGELPSGVGKERLEEIEEYLEGLY